MGRFRLTGEQTALYATQGYLDGLPPVFGAAEVEALNEGFLRLKSMLRDDEVPSDMIQWHRTSKWLYDVCTDERILDMVEGLLGPDFYLWGSEFITKAPRSDKIVPWHQDAYYWPLSPHKTVTVWLAFVDVNEANGAMKVIPGSHKGGVIKHRIADDKSILSFDLEDGTFSEEDAVTLSVPAGAFTLHDDAIIHGSAENESDRWRIGLVLRFSATVVRCDMEKNPNFLSYMVRGTDEYRHNPQGVVPVEPFARLEQSKRIRKTR